MTPLRRRALLVGAALLAAAAALAAGRYGTPGELWHYALGDTAAEIEALERRYGLSVVHEIDADFLPVSWTGSPANGTATPLGALELSRVVRQLPDLLGRYPEPVLRGSLGSVRVSASLELFGAPYGGTSFANRVYLTSQGRAAGFTAHYLALLFHHEFSSVLMRDYAFPAEAWQAANLPEMRYASDAAQILRAIEEQRDMSGSDTLYRAGLLAEYAATSLEDDVNLYAEVAFVEPARLAGLVARYPVVRAKYQVLRRFYLGIDPGFVAVFDPIDAGSSPPSRVP